MGCCESKDKKKAREVETFELNAKALFPKVVPTEPGSPDLFFAAYLFAVTSALELPEQEALDLTARAVASDAAVEKAWSNFVPQRAQVQPDKRRAAIIAAWLRFDKDHSGDFDKEEIQKLVVALNFPDTLTHQIKQKLKQNQKVSINFQDFEAMMNELVRWDELQFVWTAASEGASVEPRSNADDLVLTHANIKLFLEHTQQEIVDDSSVKMFIAQQGGVLNRRAFLKYLTDPEVNSVLDNTRINRVYQDMTQPWQNYFINSSHNTYLSGDQLTSDSKPEMYTNALLDGCRCVELDCWDGKDGRPIIYHGYTRTSKILFEDVIKAIEKDAFTTSAYPVILSLEVHTSIEQQETMAKIMRDVFGPKLALPTWQPGEEFVVTPEAFKNKIIIKGKRVSNDPDDADDDDDKPEEVKKTKASSKEQHHATAPGLSNITIMESKSMKPFPEVLQTKLCPTEVVSLTEAKSDGFSKKNREEFLRHNARRITRVYPAGHRIDSSNFHPQTHWNAGAQVVALNWQSSETYELRLNKGKFVENGNSGYLLKPQYMLSGFVPPRTGACVITLDIVSGFALPKPYGDFSGEVVDPYVKVFLEGPGVAEEPLTTKVIDDNGFCPLWNATALRLAVPVPEMTILVVQVFDKDLTSSDLLCECFVPVPLIRPGVRSFPMRDVVSHELCGTHIVSRVTVTAAS